MGEKDNSFDPRQRRCAFCDSIPTSLIYSNNLMKCSGCLLTYYCNREHQVADWKRHKLLCKELQARRSTSANDDEIIDERSTIVREKEIQAAQTLALSALDDVPRARLIKRSGSTIDRRRGEIIDHRRAYGSTDSRLCDAIDQEESARRDRSRPTQDHVPSSSSGRTVDSDRLRLDDQELTRRTYEGGRGQRDVEMQEDRLGRHERSMINRQSIPQQSIGLFDQHSARPPDQLTARRMEAIDRATRPSASGPSAIPFDEAPTARSSTRPIDQISARTMCQRPILTTLKSIDRNAHRSANQSTSPALRPADHQFRNSLQQVPSRPIDQQAQLIRQMELSQVRAPLHRPIDLIPYRPPPADQSAPIHYIDRQLIRPPNKLIDPKSYLPLAPQVRPPDHPLIRLPISSLEIPLLRPPIDSRLIRPTMEQSQHRFPLPIDQYRNDSHPMSLNHFHPTPPRSILSTAASVQLPLQQANQMAIRHMQLPRMETRPIVPLPPQPLAKSVVPIPSMPASAATSSELATPVRKSMSQSICHEQPPTIDEQPSNEGDIPSPSSSPEMIKMEKDLPKYPSKKRRRKRRSVIQDTTAPNNAAEDDAGDDAQSTERPSKRSRSDQPSTTKSTSKRGELKKKKSKRGRSSTAADDPASPASPTSTTPMTTLDSSSRKSTDDYEYYGPKKDHNLNHPMDLERDSRFRGGDMLTPAIQARHDAQLGSRSVKIAQFMAAGLREYGLAIVDKFMGGTHCRAILQETQRLHEKGEFTEAKLMRSKFGGQLQGIRSDSVMYLSNGSEDGIHIGLLTAMIDAIMFQVSGSIPPYTICGRTRPMLTCYPGQRSRYLTHVDNPDKDGRCVTATYYMNEDWRPAHGGLLRFYPTTAFKPYDVEPIFDRLVLYYSDRRNPHEVLPTYRKRFSINMWYYDAEEKLAADTRELDKDTGSVLQ